MSAKLKPCPFCGGEPKLLSGGPGNQFATCKVCKASSDDGSTERVTAAWNRRALLPAHPEPDAGRVEVPDEMVNSACMSYRHDFGLLPKLDQEALRRTARFWLEAWQKEGLALPTPPAPPREEIEHQGVVAVGVKG